MGHCTWKSSGRCHHVNFPVNPAQLFFKHNHRKGACACRYIPRSRSNGIRCSHACPCITLWWAEWDSCTESACFVQKYCPFFRQCPHILSCNKNLWKNIFHFPCILIWLQQIIKFSYHPRIIIIGIRVNRKHASGIPNTDYPFSSKLPMDIGAQRSYIV